MAQNNKFRNRVNSPSNQKEQRRKAIKNKLPDYLTEYEVRLLLDNINRTRDLLIIRLMLECGLRVSEVLNIKPNDIDTIRRLIRILGKGSKERLVPVKSQTLSLLLDYIYAHNIKPNERVFNITPRRVHQILVDAARKAGIEKRVHPHMLRHTFAVHALERGMPINVLQRILGHSDITITEIYLHVSMKDVRRMYDDYCPF